MCQVEVIEEVCIDMYSVCSRIRELCSFIRTSTHIKMYSIRTYVVLSVLCLQFQLVSVGVCTKSVLPDVSLSWCVCLNVKAVIKGHNSCCLKESAHKR